jgi:hypothetical protein
MSVLTGIEGQYNHGDRKYQPPEPYRTWEAVVRHGTRTEPLRLWNPSGVWRSTE